MGTRYGLNCKEEDCWQQGACAFTDYVLPSTVDGSTCVSEELWDTSYHCGGCISVSYKGKKIVVMVSFFVEPIEQMTSTNSCPDRSPTRLMATRTTST
jgi:hypothetical protein